VYCIFGNVPTSVRIQARAITGVLRITLLAK
jgi:hypothetical protein